MERMKTILVGKAAEPIVVDDDVVIPEGFSLNITDAGYVRMMRSTGEMRPSGSYVYEENYLHRFIMQAEKGKVVLFIDRDKRNLQRENMIVCDRAVSVRHGGGRTGRFKGVHFAKKQLKWIAQITHNGKCYHIGSFDGEEAAASAYNHAAVRIHGAHAWINTLPEDT